MKVAGPGAGQTGSMKVNVSRPGCCTLVLHSFRGSVSACAALGLRPK